MNDEDMIKNYVSDATQDIIRDRIQELKEQKEEALAKILAMHQHMAAKEEESKPGVCTLDKIDFPIALPYYGWRNKKPCPKDSPVWSIFEDIRKRPQKWCFASAALTSDDLGNYRLYNEELQVYADHDHIVYGLKPEDTKRSNPEAWVSSGDVYKLNKSEQVAIKQLTDSLINSKMSAIRNQVADKIKTKVSDLGYI